MKRAAIIAGVVLLVSLANAGETPVLKTQKDKLSYATGVDMVRSFQRQGVEVDRELFLKGVKDGLSGEPLLMSENDLLIALKEFRTRQKMKQAERMRKRSLVGGKP